MSLFARLPQSGGYADSKIARDAFLVLDERFGGERKDVLVLFLAAKSPVELANRAVGR
jgi:hypothetical protein